MAYRTPHRHLDAAPEYEWPFWPTAGAWPEWLFQTSGARLTRRDMDRIRSEFSELNGGVAEDVPRETIGFDEGQLYPARLLMFDGLEQR